MKYFCITFSIVILFTVSCFSQKLKIEYITIPDSLKENANVIIRNFDTKIERTSLGKMTHKVSIVITVLNEKGDKYSVLSIPYDKLSKITALSGKLYNRLGVLDKTIKKKDFFDYSAFPDFVFYSDNRMKSYAPESAYPYTIEYEYEVVHNETMHIESWLPVTDYNVAVEKASLKFITNSKLACRFLEKNYSFEYTKTKTDKGLDEHQWHLQNLKAIKKETFSPDNSEIFPLVYIAPNKFEYDGTFGDFSTWNNYGKWAYSLLEKRDELPQPTILAIKELVKDIPDEKEKIKIIYKYVQNKTRYVAIALGIGGFQPMFAKDVDKFGYGDCKALSNYMMALLKAVDIESFYTIIGADEIKIKYDNFPSATQTNHAILTIPLKNDTIWLECTDNFGPFGYISTFTSSRKALLIKESGGELINMPTFFSDKNVYRKEMEINILDNGNSTGTLNYTTSGYRFTEFGYLDVRQEKDQKDYLLEKIHLHNLQITGFKIEKKGDESPVAILNIDFKADKYASISGNRMFIPLNQLDKSNINFNSKQKRQFPVHFPYGMIDEDYFIFSIPDNYEIEFIPKAETFESKYSHYTAKCEIKDEKIIYSRKFCINEAFINTEQYQDLCDFFDKINKSDNAKAILKKKE